MANDDTLMAYIVPRLTSGVEDAATEALAYILNKSGGAMSALNELLQEGGFGIESIARVQTQVTYEDGCTPDMAGYDEIGAIRLLVESKFWAALQEDQARRYARHLDQPGPAMLLVIAPEVRRQTLWAEIGRQMSELGDLEPIMPRQAGVKRARMAWKESSETELHLLLVSWDLLLETMDNQSGDTDVRSDIRQLRGLAQRQDAEAFLPLHSGDLSPEHGRRYQGYCRLFDDAVDARGVQENWMNTERMAASSNRWGSGRWFRFSGVDSSFWFGVNHRLWARYGDTPLWLGLYLDDSGKVTAGKIGKEPSDQAVDVDGFRWVPVYLKTGVEYDEVLDDVAAQLRRIGGIAGGRPAATSPPS